MHISTTDIFTIFFLFIKLVAILQQVNNKHIYCTGIGYESNEGRTHSEGEEEEERKRGVEVSERKESGGQEVQMSGRERKSMQVRQKEFKKL